MPISLKDLTNRTRTVDVYRSLGASKDLWGKLNAEYFLSPDWNLEKDAEKQAAINSQDIDAIGKANAEFMAAILASWDLLDEDNQPIELDPESIRTQVPASILTDVLTAIGKDRGSVAPSKKR
jgi:hypothetical protein